MATQQQRAEATRALLLKEFRRSFLERGFEATTTERVLSATGLSKGAMYHHFLSKAQVAEALYETESRRAIERAMESVGHLVSPTRKLKGACLAWMQEIRAAGVSKILFEIGPTAIGPRKAREIEDAVSLPLMAGLLAEARAAGEIQAVDLDLAAALLNALVAEAALYAVRTRSDSTALLEAAIDAFLEKIRPAAA